jgi:hypothetical protein
VQSNLKVKVRGKEAPRIYTKPLRKLTPQTSHGFSAIQFAEQALGMNLLPWQKWLLIHMLEVLPSGRYRFRIVVVLVARQNGKSTVSQVLALWWIYVRGLKTVLGSAQDLDTAEKIWRGAVEMAEAVPELEEMIEKIVEVNGKKALVVKDTDDLGKTVYREYRVKASGRRAGRGFTGQGVVLDELREQRTWEAWSALTKTTMAKPNAQIVALSNAGDISSVVLWHLRKLGHRALGDPDGICADDEQLVELHDLLEIGDDWEDDPRFEQDEEQQQEYGDDDLGLFEWSASPNCDKWDIEEWAQANPSMNWTIDDETEVTDAAIRSACRSDPEWEFRTEVLCQWQHGRAQSEFPGTSWEDIVDPTSTIVGPVRVGVEMSFDRRWTYVCFAGRNQEGKIHVEAVARRAGDDWLEDWLMDPKRRHLIEAVTGQWKGAPISPTLQDLKDLFDDPDDPFDVPVVPWEGSNITAGFARFHDAVRDGGVVRLPQPTLKLAGVNAVTKKAGDGKMWDRSMSPVDIGSLIGCNAAFWLVDQEVGSVARSAYESHGLVTV